MNSSCVSYPANNRSLNISDWQLKATGNNHCASALLSLFESIINNENGVNDYWKKYSDENNPHQKISENSGIPLELSTLRNDLFDLWAEKKISEALDTLRSINFINIQRNPDPKKPFDRRKFIRFYPENCNQWIRENYTTDGKFIGIQNSSLENIKKQIRKNKNENSITPKSIIETAKKQFREYEKTKSNDENHDQSQNFMQFVDLIEKDKKETRESEKGESILQKGALYINNKNKYQSIKSININQVDNKNLISSKIQASENFESVVSALTAQGFSSEKFKYPDVGPAIEKLLKAGATVEMFVAAHETSCKTTSGNGFGVKYLVRVVESQLAKSKRIISDSATSIGRVRNKQQDNIILTAKYNSDFKNAMSWAGDVIGKNWED